MCSAVWYPKLRWRTGYSADSAEWCPVEPYRHVLVCGTYQLDSSEADQAKKQRRLGRIYLFEVDATSTELSPIRSIETSGILDQKWSYYTIQNYPVLAVVTSKGALQLYRLVKNEDALTLTLWIEETIGQDILALSVDWSTNKTNCDEPSLAVSDSAGNVTILKIAEGSFKRIGTWKGHGFEAWIAAFNYWNPDVFYSGGDDCLFKSYDVRVPDMPVSANRRHEAGVTSVRSHVYTEHVLLTGSYDERVRLWDARNLKRCITEQNLNGGIWRLKWHPFRKDVVLAACMYGGFKVLKVETDISVLSEYLEHESIAYGADWKFVDANPSVVATCSFYDCTLHVSNVEF